jgi:mono/diheme cytochrome c family protein
VRRRVPEKIGSVARGALIAMTCLLAAVLGHSLPAGAQSAIRDRGQVQPQDGETLYREICQGCHMPAGEGAVGAGAYPALARNEKLAVAGYPVSIVIAGRKAMPSFARMLDDAQAAAVVNYVRTHFGNRYADPVTAADAAAARH